MEIRQWKYINNPSDFRFLLKNRDANCFKTKSDTEVASLSGANNFSLTLIMENQ